MWAELVVAALEDRRRPTETLLAAGANASAMDNGVGFRARNPVGIRRRLVIFKGDKFVLFFLHLNRTFF